MNQNRTIVSDNENSIPVRCPILACKCTKGKKGKLLGWVKEKERDGPSKEVAFPCKYKKVSKIWINIK
ncbi:MAG: hypothetical protein H8E18_04505 [FCB group bacterium]|nr:hypothetical protein [FCB group bacterium]